ncbi:MAG: MBL fold metallo-hydrolase [Chloroflexi bacterium]|nr:MBL fold metallo-hydrolase [Chloroflexota bacterium]
MELVKDVFAYVWEGQGNNSNSYALRYHIDGQARYVLIDPGHDVIATPMRDPGSRGAMRLYEEPGLDALIEQLGKDGIDLKDIGLVINTHGHIDHCEASFSLAEKTGVPVALHEGDKESCNRTIADMLGMGPADKSARKERQPDLFLKEGEMRLGKPDPIVLQIIHTPGHSPGSISVYWPEKKTLIAGDVIFYRSTGRWDLPGGDIRLLKQSVARLAALDCELLLAGHPYGHPGIIKGKKEIQTNFSFALHQVLA